MTSAFVIREASPIDAPEIARVFRKTREHNLPYLPSLHTPEEDLQFFERLAATSRIVTAIEDGKVIGFCAFRDGWLDHIYVLPRHQRHGIGTRLLKEVMNQCPQLQLWVFQKNQEARTFYEAHGFRLAETTDGLGNEEKEPDARYVWARA